MSRLVLLFLVLLPQLALAQTACTFSSTPGMAFGPYDDSSAAPTDTATSIEVRCARNGGPANVDVTMRLGPSSGSGAISPRQLRSGANALNYNLYRDAGRTQVWGQTTGVDTASITINGIPNNGSRTGTFTVYGRIPARENVPAGAYTDSVQITISP